MRQASRLATLPFLIAATALGGCGGCDDPDLVTVSPRIVVQPERLDLGEVPRNVEAQGTVTLQNAGGVTLQISDVGLVDGSAGFQIVDEALVERPLPAGQSSVVVIRLDTSELGSASDTLRIASDDPERPTVEVPIVATVVEPPPCDDGNACTSDAFDPATNECVHTFTDGVSCTPLDRCVVDAVCSQGVCLGAGRVCNDDNPCTRDLCRQSDGMCLFTEEEDICDDDNPCTADSCTPDGCVHEPVPSGVACDDGDLCTEGDACLAGRCTGAGIADGSPCDDNNSCTRDDICTDGVCAGASIVEPAAEGDIVFDYGLAELPARSFLHRREVSLGDSGVFYGLDHVTLPDQQGLTHTLFAMQQCGTETYAFTYRPPDANVLVSFVRRAIQVDPEDSLRLVVGVRQTEEDGFRPQTTTYVLSDGGAPLLEQIQRLGGETGRSLLPDGSEIFGVIFPLTEGPPTDGQPSRQNLVIVREDRTGFPIWRHERRSGEWAEFFGVAGPRILFWAEGRFGALDFNTGALVWSRETPFTSDEMALSTVLNLGIIRTKPDFAADRGQLIAVEILEGNQVFAFPSEPDPLYFPRTEPVISATGVIGVLMQRNRAPAVPESLEWVELDERGQVLTETPLPYQFPQDFAMTRHEDFRDDPFPTVADDGVTYVGYGDQLWALDPDGGGIRWMLTSNLPFGEALNAFTGTVPLLRDDGILLISEGRRRVLGIKTNGGQMTDGGWSSFRNDGRRTNYTPPADVQPN